MRFDPSEFVDMAEQTVRAYIKIASWGERQFFELVRSGLNGAAVPDEPDSIPVPPPEESADSLDVKLRTLLDRAVEQTTAASRQDLFHEIVDQLVPDEARIISALSEG